MFKTNFVLMQEHKYSLSELEMMMPWERTVYTSLLVAHIQKENERIRQIKAQRRARGR